VVLEVDCSREHVTEDNQSEELSSLDTCSTTTSRIIVIIIIVVVIITS